MNENLLTITGKSVLMQCAYRLPIEDYQRLLKLCQRRKTNVSAFSRLAVQAAMMAENGELTDEAEKK